MATREEIREGMRGIGVNTTAYDSNISFNLSDKDIGEILAYLHSQGVVIKVDRELPDRASVVIIEGDQSVVIPIKILTNAGYEAVEPLIKEK